jgi:hypothetical protein
VREAIDIVWGRGVSGWVRGIYGVGYHHEEQLVLYCEVGKLEYGKRLLRNMYLL